MAVRIRAHRCAMGYWEIRRLWFPMEKWEAVHSRQFFVPRILEATKGEGEI